MNKAKVLIDMTGQRFGRWIVLCRGPNPPGSWSARWYCRCDCGTEKLLYGSSLRKGHTRGCYSCANKIHGHSKSRAYKIWEGVKARCQNPRRREYKNYGGRGISLCDRWQNFTTFYADMGDPPPKHDIDRIDNDGNYEPGNCKWVDQATNRNHTRRSHWITIGSETKTMSDWCRFYGVNPITAAVRIKRGWPEQKAVSVPARRCKPKIS